MLFNSLQFLLFFPIIVTLYFAIPHAMRWLLLLVASAYFYMCWRPLYILVLFALILLDYFVGLQMARTPDKTKRKKYLTLSLFGNLSILFFFKYIGLFQETMDFVLAPFPLAPHFTVWRLVLPIGVSFHTFQAMGYSVDVYEVAVKAEKNIGIFALFGLIFPPIGRRADRKGLPPYPAVLRAACLRAEESGQWVEADGLGLF